MSTQLTLFVLVDALRPDYLVHAPYLRSLAAGSATGALRECFGFVPRQAYFGGLDAGEYGFTNMYCYDPEHSPFSVARAVPTYRREPAGLRTMVETAARERMAPFERSYAGSIEIPIDRLPYFDLVEKRAPWDRKVGYRSLFAILDELGLPWRERTWPGTNQLPDHSDAGIVKAILEDLKPEHRLACVHLQELDGLGHAFGPNSRQVRAGIEATDGHCRKLIETLKSRYDRLNLILFGDHGMVSVTRTLDLEPLLVRTGLVHGIDYVYFLDSTMARFWFHHAKAREIVTAVLSDVTGGRLLDAAGMKHYGIDRCDPRNAEAVFLADPGVLIFPNYFQASGEPIRGMHGYDPDCADNLGAFILHDTARPELAGQALGRVNPPAIFPLLLDLLGLEASAHTPTLPPVAVPQPLTSEYLTGEGSLEAEAVVRGHLDRIVQAVTERVGPVEAIVLTGSFGRGEGGVYRDAAGVIRPVNDYDLLVIDRRPLQPALAGLGESLARELGIDFVDLGWSDGQWSKLPLTVFHYDLKYGSRVIAGDRTVLDRIPAYASAEMPSYEIVKLLLNRSAGLLSGLSGEAIRGAALSADAARYLANQTAKALIAVGDWHLLRWEGFDSSYRLRSERFAALAPGVGIPAAQVEAIVAAYAFKCRPDYQRIVGSVDEVRSLQPALLEALLGAVNFHVEAHARTVADVMDLYLAELSADTAWVKADNERVAQHPVLAPLLKPDRPAGISLRHLVFAAVPALLPGLTGSPAEAAFAARVRLDPYLVLPPVGSDDWEVMRSLVIRLWFAICH